MFRKWELELRWLFKDVWRGGERKSALCVAIPNHCHLSSLSDGAPLNVAVTFLERSNGSLPACRS